MYNTLLSTRIIPKNANGLTQRDRELETFLTIYNIDIHLISDTRFTDKNFVK